MSRDGDQERWIGLAWQALDAAEDAADEAERQPLGEEAQAEPGAAPSHH